MVARDIDGLTNRLRDRRIDRRPSYLIDLELDALYEDLRRQTGRRSSADLDEMGDVRAEIEALGLDPDEVLPASPPKS